MLLARNFWIDIHRPTWAYTRNIRHRVMVPPAVSVEVHRVGASRSDERGGGEFWRAASLRTGRPLRFVQRPVIDFENLISQCSWFCRRKCEKEIDVHGSRLHQYLPLPQNCSRVPLLHLPKPLRASSTLRFARVIISPAPAPEGTSSALRPLPSSACERRTADTAPMMITRPKEFLVTFAAVFTVVSSHIEEASAASPDPFF